MQIAQKAYNEIRSALFGSRDYSFVEDSLTSWVYPLDLAFTLTKHRSYYPTFDPYGIPTKDHGDGALHYNPTRIAAYGLAHHDRYLLVGAPTSLEAFLRVADWFTCKEDAVWLYDFKWRTLQAPWKSAMAQGVGISVLVRAYNLTGKSAYLDKAVAAILPLTQPIERDGLRSTLPNGHPFLEEYPTTPPKHVLNGFLYTLIGLAAIDRMDPSLLSDVGLSLLVQSLDESIHLWDCDYWSTYDLDTVGAGLTSEASLTYHRVHIAQLSYLGRYFDLSTLLRVADKWKARQASASHRLRALTSRIRYLRATRRI